MHRTARLVKRAHCSLEKRTVDHEGAGCPTYKFIEELKPFFNFQRWKARREQMRRSAIGHGGLSRLSVTAGALGHPALPNACSIARCASASTAANRNTSPPPSCIWAPKCVTARTATSAHSSRPPPRAPDPSNGTDTVRWPDSRAPTRNKIRSKVPIPGNFHLDRHSKRTRMPMQTKQCSTETFIRIVLMKLDIRRGSQRSSERNGATVCKTNL